MSASSELLQQLEGLAELVAVTIENQDWDALNAVLIDRQMALEQLCALSLSAPERELVINMMASMQVSDQQWVALVQSQKEVLQKQAVSLAHDRKAIQAYHQSE